MKVANKHKMYLVEANVMISKSQSHETKKIEEFHPKKSIYGYVGRPLSYIVGFALGEKVGIDSTIRMYTKDI